MKPYYKNYLVSQNNLLIQKISTDTDISRNPLMSSFLLDNYQRKLVAIMISHITKDTIDFCEEVIPFNSFVEMIGVRRGGNQYREIIKSIDKLLRMSFCIEVEPGVFEYHHWFKDGCRIDTNKNLIYVCFSDGMRKFLLEKTRCFTQYELGYILSLKKKYSSRLYEYLHSFLAFGSANISAENIKKLITDNEVKENKYIKALVLEPAIAEINNKTDLQISYEPYYKKDINGKKYLSSFNFKIDLQDEDLINDIKINKWGLDEDFVLYEE